MEETLKMIEYEDDEDLFLWYEVLHELWAQTDREFDVNLCPYSLSEIEREIIRCENIRQELE